MTSLENAIQSENLDELKDVEQETKKEKISGVVYNFVMTNACCESQAHDKSEVYVNRFRSKLAMKKHIANGCELMQTAEFDEQFFKHYNGNPMRQTSECFCYNVFVYGDRDQFAKNYEPNFDRGECEDMEEFTHGELTKKQDKQYKKWMSSIYA